MNVMQRQVRPAFEALHDRGSEADVGNEMPVHHIHMDQMGAALFDLTHIFTKMIEIR